MSPDSPTERRGGIAGALERVPGKAWLRMGVLVAILVTGFLLVRFTPLGEFFDRDRMIALLEQLETYPGAPLLLIVAYAILAPLGLPMSPLVAGGGVVFKPLMGSVYNILGLAAGAMTAYVVGKALGRDFIAHLAGPRLRRVERMFERRGFWPLVQARFMPVPFWLVSYSAALAGVKVPQFIITTILGLIPATVMHTYFMSRLFHETVGREAPSAGDGSWGGVGLTFVLYLTIWASLVIVTGWPTLREGLRRRRRYRELREARRARG